MSAPKTPAQTIGPWLRANGMNLGGLTGQDWPALKAAAEIIGAYSSSDSEGQEQCTVAFGAMVRVMQPNMRYLAFHAIAHVCDWGTREEVWERAGLQPLIAWQRCKEEPARRSDGGAS